MHDTSKTKNARANFAPHMLKETSSLIESLLIDGISVDTICNMQYMQEYFENVHTI